MEKLKDNEILIITDYNNTFVDYASEFDYSCHLYDDFEGFLRMIKRAISRALVEFENKTGLTPVICIVTNASFNTVDANGYHGICNDLKMTFFNHSGQTRERALEEINGSCEKYIKYVIHKENDGLLEIFPLGEDMEGTFKVRLFSEKAMQIKRSAKKRESVERLISEIGPIKNNAIIFAGDSIADDYPMKYAVSGEGLCKIFIRPGKVRKMKPSIMQQFCEAKEYKSGVKLSAVNPKNNKPIKVIDESTIRFLTDEQRAELYNYSDGDHILLTSENSRGFAEGILQSIEIINSLGISGKERDKD